ncbi:MAG: molybdopterin molybdotransferase MoeA [Chloroflexi bacterium]|nr:molybdopterin molybdotransferase MoeA [Chloroflexota bacterium]MCI0576137.1 molybdopterin molybdotransferase MoeA [Chloroflexota bacterium]MCI0647925.1 molybdopterin molybdotransferase MoeA [Chloroflexota bacterium]MCI0727176.1 molybdopterin molybdotransferase MoeA [Chloroflexota bacterium]
MPEFFNVLPPEEARALLFQHLAADVAGETVPTEQALGRVTAGALHAPQALPDFRRSTMDGYAVRANDTYGASEGLPAFLYVVGEAPMGRPATIELRPGQAAVVHTGGMIPETADAVVPVEYTQVVGGQQQLPFEIEVVKAVAVGQNVLQVGEDVRQGEEILPAGHWLRPQDLGGLLALGVTVVTVARRPRVAILSTGDEVVPPGQTPGPGQVRDINSYTIAGQAAQAGGIPVLYGIIPDDFAALQEAAARALAENDMLAISAGSSVSVRDMTVQVIQGLGEPGVLLHGVATRPGKPTIVGVAGGKPVLGLPGNPVSAMIQFDMFGVPAIYRLQGLPEPPRQGIVWAKLSQNVASESGREDYVPVRLVETKDGLLAVPVFGKSNLIYTLVKADGLLKVPLNKGGLAAGEWAEVRLF